MKLTQLKAKSASSLKTHTDKLREQIAAKRRDMRISDTKNVREVRNLRKELAQSLTLLREKAKPAKRAKQ